MANSLPTTSEKLAWQAHFLLNMHARDTLGSAQWTMLNRYGKVMNGGPHGGLYVSGLPPDEATKIVDALLTGEIVDVHLMHRHRSGNYEASSLCRRAGRLIMLFDDRSEFA